MSSRPHALLAYDAQGNVVAHLDHMVAKNEAGEVVGLVDFAAHEAAGGRLRDIWDVQQLDAAVPLEVAREVLGRDPEPDDTVVLPPKHPFRLAHDRVAGSGSWPEWLGGRVHDFRVELDHGAPLRIAALVHKKSGHRRHRAGIEATIAKRIREKQLEAARLGKARRAELKRLKVSQSVIDEAVDPEPEPTDLRDLLGGPMRHLLLDDAGKTMTRPKFDRPSLPIVER